MDIVSIRIITDDIKRLVRFYEDITGLSPTWYTEDFAELATPSCTLAIASTRTMDLFGAGAARPADNHSAIIEFRVGDVDAVFRRLAPIIGDVVQKPTTQPWGKPLPCCFATPTGPSSTSSRRSARRRSRSMTVEQGVVLRGAVTTAGPMCRATNQGATGAVTPLRNDRVETGRT